MKNTIATLFRPNRTAPRAAIAAMLLAVACGFGGCAGGGTVITWVWDVYDRDQQRALRLSGEEPAGKAGRDPWTAADDLVLRKIAQAGMSGLSAMINGTAPDAAPAPGRRGPAMASAEGPSSPSGEFSVTALGYGSH